MRSTHGLFLMLALVMLSACGLPTPPDFEPTRSRIITPEIRGTSTPTRAPTAAVPTDTPVPSLVQHRVQRGETLSRIARRYGVAMQDIQQANGIRNPNLVYIGQELVIPVPAEVAAPTALAAAFTPTPAFTNTAVPTETPSPSPSPIALPTATPSPTSTPTEAPTATLTPTDTPIPTATASATPTPVPSDTPTATTEATPTPSHTPAPTSTPRPTATPTATATPTPEPRKVCGGEAARLEEQATVVSLASGATILVPPDWRAEEVVGVAGPLPYLSDEGVSAMMYLVGRPAEVDVDASLDLVLTLSGAREAQPVLRRVEGDTGVAVWDETTGEVHHVLVGYVVPGYTGVLATTSAFCPSASAHTEAEAEEFAQLLIQVVDSYQPAG